MSNFQNSNKILNNKNTKYSLDEIEISENNTTHNDSLHKEKKIYRTSNKKYLEEQTNKQQNYYLALNTIQKKVNDTFQELSLNEFSQINKINTKEKNISNYIKNPIIKDVIKIGNILKTIKTPKVKKSLINLDNNTFNRINLNNIIVNEQGQEEENTSTIINETKYTKSITISNKKESNKNVYNNINNTKNNDKNLIKENNIHSNTKTKNKNIEKKPSIKKKMKIK